MTRNPDHMRPKRAKIVLPLTANVPSLPLTVPALVPVAPVDGRNESSRRRRGVRIGERRDRPSEENPLVTFMVKRLA